MCNAQVYDSQGKIKNFYLSLTLWDIELHWCQKKLTTTPKIIGHCYT